MKGAGTLAALVGLAIVTGVALTLLKPEDNPATAANPPESALTLAESVEQILGLSFRNAPAFSPVGQRVLLDEIESNLDARFGPGGLMRRTRALELLGFADLAERTLRDEMVVGEAGGVRGWFDDRTGRILVPDDFDESDPHDRVTAHGLLARLLVHQHTPPTIGTLPDDEWIARRALHAALAESVMAKLRAENRAAFELPTPTQTEREAVILALPIYLHQLANLPLEKGEARIFLETRLRTGARALTDLVAEPPRTTLELLNGDPSTVAPPRLPPALPDSQVQLEESLGAFALQALLEWLEDYEQAQALAPLWRGDRYRLFANTSGDHLLWICNWETEAAANRAAEIVNTRLPKDSTRHLAIKADGKSLRLANCADQATLHQIAVPPSE